MSKHKEKHCPLKGFRSLREYKKIKMETRETDKYAYLKKEKEGMVMIILLNLQMVEIYSFKVSYELYFADKCAGAGSNAQAEWVSFKKIPQL